MGHKLENNKLFLKKFTIEKLNGDQLVSISFSDNMKVVVAENGSGKTTIMNILYYCLTNNIKGLQKYDFKTCILEFSGENQTIYFSKDRLNKINDKEDFRVRSRINYNQNDQTLYNKISIIVEISDSILKNFGILALERFLVDWALFLKNIQTQVEEGGESLKKLISSEKKQFIYKILESNDIFINSLNNEKIYKTLYSVDYKDITNIYMMLGRREFIDDYNYQSSIDSYPRRKRILRNDFRMIFRDVVNSIVKEGIKDNESEKKLLESIKIIFLPTYRRIEQESIELISGEISVKDDSISFGIADVSSLFNKIFDKINNFVKDSFNAINSSALNDLISGDHESDYSIEKWTDEDYFVNVLERVGTLIDNENKLKLILKFRERGSDDKFLLKLIRKMCEIYDTQLKIEDEIKKYIKVCNKYLFNKKFYYDERKLKIQIFKNKSNGSLKEISLASLSSGEKQIVSLFAKLYLLHLPSIDLNNLDIDQTSGYWVLFDEPELSLSVKWQEMLLPDIKASKKCDFIFATTHSPFIFDNEFSAYTSDIGLSITEVENG